MTFSWPSHGEVSWLSHDFLMDRSHDFLMTSSWLTATVWTVFNNLNSPWLVPFQPLSCMKSAWTCFLSRKIQWSNKQSYHEYISVYIHQYLRSHLSPIIRGQKGRNVYVVPYCDRMWHNPSNIFGFLKKRSKCNLPNMFCISDEHARKARKMLILAKIGVFDLNRLNRTPCKFFMKSCSWKPNFIVVHKFI